MLNASHEHVNDHIAALGAAWRFGGVRSTVTRLKHYVTNETWMATIIKKQEHSKRQYARIRERLTKNNRH